MKHSPRFEYHYHLHADRTASPVLSSSAANVNDAATTLWQHLDVNEGVSKNWLNESSGLDQIIVDSLSAEETRPRSVTAKNGILVVLRGVNTNPGQEAEDMVSVRLWLEKQRIISTQRRPLLAITDIAASFNEQQGPRNSGEFLTHLIEKLADRIGNFVNRIEEDMGDAEDNLETMQASDLRATLGSLRRQIATVRRFLAPQRDALDRLNHTDTDILSSHDRQRLREESDRISRYLEDLDLARERAIVLQEAFLSQLAQEQNSRMYVLSVVAAIFLPLGFLTGLLGMNVGGLPGVENAHGFAIATSVMVSATIGLIALFKWKKWI